MMNNDYTEAYALRAPDGRILQHTAAHPAALFEFMVLVGAFPADQLGIMRQRLLATGWAIVKCQLAPFYVLSDEEAEVALAQPRDPERLTAPPSSPIDSAGLDLAAAEQAADGAEHEMFATADGRLYERREDAEAHADELKAQGIDFPEDMADWPPKGTTGVGPARPAEPPRDPGGNAEG